MLTYDCLLLASIRRLGHSDGDRMVFPGIVRRAMKLMPTLIQALALVVFIHVVGQVK